MNETTLNVDFTKISTFTGRSVENGVPVTSPLHNLEEVFSWTPNDEEDKGQCFTVARFPFNPKLRTNDDPKTLVCHDMKGGYINDRFAQGYKLADDNWYNFTHWDVVDTFVYFSHHFVTIPPVGWINAAHKNSVAVLGTVITEGTDGELRWMALLSCEELWKKFADQLIAISSFYGFEGWLLNVENKIEEKNIPALVSFIKYLHDKTKTLVEGGQLIWYDSVTSDGTLHWQNELNEKNSLFFDVCDGIFLNYFWKESGIADSLKRAGTRGADVYVGIDVFGRSTYGGGGFNSTKALEIIQKYKLSTAIFAPGWVKEVLGDKSFTANQQKFWNFMGALLPSYPSKTNGFSSNFNDGMQTFYNLSSQSFLPRLSYNNQITLSAKGAQFDPAGDSCTVYQVYVPVPQGSTVALKLDEFVGDVSLKIQKVAGDYEIVSMVHANAERVGKPLEGHNLIYPRQESEAFQVYEIICNPRPDVKFLSYIKLEVVDADNNNIKSVMEDNKLKNCDPTVLPISLEHVSWKKQEHIFLLSLVLCFDNLPANTAYSDVLYGCICPIANDPTNGELTLIPIIIPSSPIYVELGKAYCSKFRINELKVPNPMFFGASSAVFNVVHYDYLSQYVAISQIKINYFENFRS